MAIFHFTVKIVGRSKGKSVISASAYLNGDVMKNEETGRISYYTSKKEVVYTSLMMCENAPPEWLHVPEENIKRFQQSIRYKRADDKDAALEKFKITFQKQRLWNEVLKIEKNADAQLGRSFEFSLPKEWSRQEQMLEKTQTEQAELKAKVSEGRKRLSDEVQLANDAKQWVEAIQEYANITELDAATLNRLIKEIVVHERIDEDKTRHISIEIHFNLKPIPEVEQVTA